MGTYGGYVYQRGTTFTFSNGKTYHMHISVPAYTELPYEYRDFHITFQPVQHTQGERNLHFHFDEYRRFLQTTAGGFHSDDIMRFGIASVEVITRTAWEFAASCQSRKAARLALVLQ
jgi:hypothetical protein